MPADTPRPRLPRLPLDPEDLELEGVDDDLDDDEDDEDDGEGDSADELDPTPILDGEDDYCPDCDEPVDACECDRDDHTVAWSPVTNTPHPAEPAFPEPVDPAWACFTGDFTRDCSCSAPNCRRCGQCSSDQCACHPRPPLTLDPPRPGAVPPGGGSPNLPVFHEWVNSFRARDSLFAAGVPAPRPDPGEAPPPPETASRAPRMPEYDKREETSRRVEWLEYPTAFFPPDPRPAPGTAWPPGAPRPGPKDSRLPRRYVSVEIEVGGLQAGPSAAARVREACEKWQCPVVYDGSLPSTGFEVNTSPAKGRYFADQVADLTKALRAGKAWVNWKCGMHVHVDSRDLSDAQVLRLIQVYARVEDGLFLVVPDSRRRNGEYRRRAGGDRTRGYCEKCAGKLLAAMTTYLKKPDQFLYWGVPPADVRKRQKYRTRRLLRQAVYGGLGGSRVNEEGYDAAGRTAVAARDRLTGARLGQLAQSRYQAARYYALNLHAHFYKDGRTREDGTNPLGLRYPVGRARGTIECRLAAGTTDPEKILPWAHLWDNIVHAATAWPTRDVDALPQDPFEALLAVAPDEAVRKWLVARKEKFAGVNPAPEEDF